MACKFYVTYVREDDDSNIRAVITWFIWTSLSAARDRPLNFIIHLLNAGEVILKDMGKCVTQIDQER